MELATLIGQHHFLWDPHCQTSMKDVAYENWLQELKWIAGDLLLFLGVRERP
jgi:hypothetical protein